MEDDLASLEEESDEEAWVEEEPEVWTDPVACPACRSNQVRIMKMRYERAVYECETCRFVFEEEA